MPFFRGALKQATSLCFEKVKNKTNQQPGRLKRYQTHPVSISYSQASNFSIYIHIFRVCGRWGGERRASSCLQTNGMGFNHKTVSQPVLIFAAG